MFLLSSIEFITDENGIPDKGMLEWILSFADIVGINKNNFNDLINIRDDPENSFDFDISTYTSVMDINEYINYINKGNIGVFSDSVCTGRVVKQLLTQLVDDKWGNSTLSSFCNVNCDNGNNDSGKTMIELEYAIIGGVVVIIIGIIIGMIVFVCWKNKWLKRQQTSNENLKLLERYTAT
eukprot:149242_1